MCYHITIFCIIFVYMHREKPTNNEIYHIYNRGVEKRKIFLDDQDRIRFVHDLYEFNDQEAAPNLTYHVARHLSKSKESKEVGLPNIVLRKPRKLLVELMAFCMMPNHFHLIVKQKSENGVVKFMRKLGTGYTNYFNQKYERVGPLFQGKYKSVRLKDESHLIHLPYYIHFNPLDLVAPEWRTGKLNNYKRAVQFLESYRWSSHLDYLGKKNFPSVTQREFLAQILGDSREYEGSARSWLKNLDLDEIKDVSLE